MQNPNDDTMKYLESLTIYETDMKKYYLKHDSMYPIMKFANMHPTVKANTDITAEMLKHTVGLKAYLAKNSCKNILVLTESLIEKSELDVVIRRHSRYMGPVPHIHTFYEMIYVISGSCHNVIDGIPLQMKKGDICIIPPNILHEITIDNDGIVINILIRSSTFTESFFLLLKGNDILADFFKEVRYGNKYHKYIMFHTSGDASLCSITLEIYKHQQNQGKYIEKINYGLFYTFLGLLLQNYEYNIDYPDEFYLHKDYISKILAYIDYNYANTTLQKCAEHFHFHPQYLSFFLKKHTGKTFIKLLTDVKLNVAKKMLLQSDLSVNAIANEVGYSELSYFVKVFKKNIGITPSEFRKNINPFSTKIQN